MGRATRWFRSLLGMKKEKKQRENSNGGDRKDKRRWSFGKSGRDATVSGQLPAGIPANVPAAEVAWPRSYYTETESEQNKHAIAVAAATDAAQAAVAVDAAVAAAESRRLPLPEIEATTLAGRRTTCRNSGGEEAGFGFQTG